MNDRKTTPSGEKKEVPTLPSMDEVTKEEFNELMKKSLEETLDGLK